MKSTPSYFGSEILDGSRYRFKDIKRFMNKEEPNDKFDGSAEAYDLLYMRLPAKR